MPKEFRQNQHTQRVRFKSTIGRQMSAMTIDRELGIIEGTTAMEGGVEALGHGFMSDDKTLEIMLELSKQSPDGVLMRFGHPGASDNAMGYQVAVAKDFYIDDGNLRHDVHLIAESSKSPRFAQDPTEYLLDIAENNPRWIGESVVISTNAVWVMADGSERPAGWFYNEETGEYVYGSRPDDDEELKYELPVLRPLDFHNVDFVMEGALTHDGLFQKMFDGTGHAYADQAFQFVDQWREQFNIPLEQVPRKVRQVLGRYLEQRGYESGVAARELTMEFEEDLDDVAVEETVGEETIVDEDDDALDEAETLLDEVEESLGDEDENDDAGEQVLQIKEASFDFASRRDVIALHKRVQRQDAVIARMSKALGQLNRRLSQLQEENEVSVLNGLTGASLQLDVDAKHRRTRKQDRPNAASLHTATKDELKLHQMLVGAGVHKMKGGK